MGEAELLVDRTGPLAVLRLNRPKAINALSMTMLEGIETWLGRLAADNSVGAVLIRGEGERGFCACGDVRALREHVLAGRADAVRDYFKTEYRVDALVGAFPKPVIAIQHAVVMGGGIGLSAHARHRVCLEGARFAMPEPAIGFFADVGVNFALREAPIHRALLFLMSGETSGAADAIALGLSDAMVSPADLDKLQAELVAAAQAVRPDAAIRAAIGRYAADPGPAEFVAGCDGLESAARSANPASLMARVEAAGQAGDGFAAKLASAFRRGCPTSIAVNWANHRSARRLGSLGDVLAQDLRFAIHMAGRADFAEGVRAVLVDRQPRPKWSPDRLASVDLGALSALAG
ncbi:MAG: enoyl-CoA hydratase/isomerase family protein [Cucumibacter sp.]